jgi:hypothetical protein
MSCPRQLLRNILPQTIFKEMSSPRQLLRNVLPKSGEGGYQGVGWGAGGAVTLGLAEAGEP